jgi:uncharacterized membrane protein YhhN
LVISVALLSWLSPAVDSRYTSWVVVALLFSLMGDVALMGASQKAFLVGMLAFLLAHVVYAGLFTLYNGWQAADGVTAVVLTVAAVGGYRLLLPGLGKIKVPVALYVLIIALMTQRALSTLFGDAFTRTQAWTIAGGALLFLISDVMLAINRFARPFKYHRISLAFYYGGQLLLALSASYF